MNDFINMNGYGMGFGWIVPALFIFVLIYFINNIIKGDASAKDILDKKYANGEINEQEYKSKKKLLES